MFSQEDFERDFKQSEKRIRDNRRYIFSRAKFIACFAIAIFIADIVAIIGAISFLVYLYIHYWRV